MAFFLFILLVVLNATILVLVNRWLGPRNSTPEKEELFECGAEEITPPPVRYRVHFYRLAIAFVVLDIELAFFIPWAVSVDELGWAGFAIIGFYTALLAFGYAYFWKKGGLKFWERPKPTP